MSTLTLLFSILLASITFMVLNRARGNGTIPRPLFAYTGAFVLVQGAMVPTLVLGSLLWGAWAAGWGKYLGAIVSGEIHDEKEDPIVDFLMRPLDTRINPVAWGTVATSLRFFIYMIPVYFYIFGPWRELFSEGVMTSYQWLIPASTALLAGPCYLLAEYYARWKWDQDETVVDAWGLGEWIVAFWLAVSMLVFQNWYLLFGDNAVLTLQTTVSPFLA